MERPESPEAPNIAELGPIDPKVALLLSTNPVHKQFTSWKSDDFFLVKDPAYLEIRSRLGSESKLKSRDFPRRESIEKKMKLRTPKKKKQKKKKKKSKKDKSSGSSETDTTSEEDQIELTHNFVINTNEFFEVDNEGSSRRIKLAYMYDPKTKIPIWSLIKDLLGKDLTKFAVPVYVCEPLSMLQRVLEAWNFRNLVLKASEEPDQYKRLANIAIFMVIQYTATLGRNKKPFNPLLGETFEYEIDGIRMLVEQVSHHPPISAFHVESEDFVSWGHIKLKSKLQTTGLDVTTQGSLFI